MTAKTVKEHTDEADTITKHVRDANALLEKLRDELDRSRRSLTELKVFAPSDRFKIAAPHYLRSGSNTEDMSMIGLIDAQIKRINALLGDRA